MALHLSFPTFRVEWIALVLSASYFSQGPARSFALVVSLSFFYSAFSLASFWQWSLPYLLGLGFFAYLYPKFAIGKKAGFGFLILWLWVADWLFWNTGFLIQGKGFGFQGLIWAGATLIVGVVILPKLKIWLRVWRKKIFSSRRRMGELPIYQARLKGNSVVGGQGKPFGFQ